MKNAIRIKAKCSDMFFAILIENGKQTAAFNGYVPNWFPNPNQQHFGDYVELTIDIDNGKILNWQKPTAAQLAKTFYQ